MKYVFRIAALFALCGLNAQASPADSSSKVAMISMGECSAKNLDAKLGGNIIWLTKQDIIQWNSASRECLYFEYNTQDPQIPGSPYPNSRIYSFGPMAKIECCAKAQYLCPGTTACSRPETD